MQSELLTRRRVLSLAAAGLAAGALPPGTLSPALLAGDAKPSKAVAERTAFFEGGKIPRLDLQIERAALDSLRGEPRKYVKAQLTEDGQTVYADVGLHLKGAAGSFRGVDDKPGMTFNLDKFEDAQRFHALEKFHLNNCAQDGSYLSELLVGEMYRAAGVPAARVTHATVTLNGRKLGFYALKEGYDKGFLKAHFADPTGNFYDGGFLRDLDQPLQLISGKGEPKDQAELKSLAEVSREPDLARRFERLGRRLDMDRFVSYLSLQVLTWDWDGYPLNRNNYRVYHDPQAKRLTFIPSGMDQMFADPNGPLIPGFQGFVAARLMETPEGRKRYLARTAQLLNDVLVPDKLSKRLDELVARVQPAFRRVDEGAANDLPNQANRLRDGIRVRARKIKQELERTKK